MKTFAAFAVGALVALGGAAPPAESAPRFESCGPYGFECARLSVPLDRSGEVRGRVSLFVKRIRARQRPSRGALFVLAGGPGQSATAAFGGGALAAIRAAYRRYDLIVLDQRGTGRSGALRCRPLERANLLRAGRAAARCARRLGPRRAFFTTRDSVADLEAVRAALGARRVALFGTSYGTKVALAYALAFPARVDRLVLDSVVELNGPNALYLDTIEAVPRALHALCGPRGCASFTPDPVADIAALVARLAGGALRGRLPDDRGHPRPVSLDRGDLLAVLLAGDFDPALRASTPAAVRSALDGDAAPLLRLRRRAFDLDGTPPPPRLLSSALYTATTCEETEFPWPRTSRPDPAARMAAAAAAADAIPDAEFLPFDRATALDNDLLELCAGWPAAAAPPSFGPGPPPDVPALLIAGEDDLRTPLESAQRVAALFPRAELVVAPATGHSALGADPGGCTEQAFARFFADRPVRDCGPVRRPFPPTAPVPTELSELDPVAGVGAARGRVLAAVATTLSDVGDDALTQFLSAREGPDLARGGGLRAGSYRIDGRLRLTLRGLAFVPGVRLRGYIERFGLRRQQGRIRVRGLARAANGVLTIRGRRVSGRLGGRRVAARLTTGATATRARATAARLPVPAR